MAQPADLAIVGAGILGLATAREVLRRRPGLRLLIIEKEPQIALHQTGRNSGVIHSGIYYAPGSLRARLCVEGARRLMEFCDQHGVPYRRCGKLILATRESELPGLEELHRRGSANSVPGLELIGPDRIRELEPHAAGLKAIYSPTTAIVDFRQVAHALARDVEAGGGVIRTGSEVVSIKAQGGGWTIGTSQGTVRAGAVITCAGLYADRVAAMTGAPKDPPIVPFRGHYWRLKRGREDLVRGLIYPVPDPTFPFLGVHFTPRMDGQVWLGPNAVLAFAREGYRWTTLAVGDTIRILTGPGFLNLARRYWRTGLIETYRAINRRALLDDLRRFVPGLEGADIESGPAGVRAQAVSRHGKLIDDFVLDGEGSTLHVRNAPSPAATACLSIASYIADRGPIGKANGFAEAPRS